MINGEALKEWLSVTDKTRDFETETGKNTYIRLKDLMEHIDEAEAAMEAIRKIPQYYDREEIIENCTVQLLINSVTGNVSVGWWRNR